MFIYLSKKIAIPNGVKLNCISWNPKRRRQRPAQGRTRRGALALALAFNTLIKVKISSLATSHNSGTPSRVRVAMQVAICVPSQTRPGAFQIATAPAMCIGGARAHPWSQDLFGHRRKSAPEIDPPLEIGCSDEMCNYALIFGSPKVHIIKLKFAQKISQH